MKTLWIIFALLAFLVCIPLSLSLYNDYKVVTQGHLVKVVIKSIPGIGLGKGSYMYFYNDTLNDYIKVYGDYGALHHVGDTIELQYLTGLSHHFLFKNNNPIFTGIAVLIFLLLCGICCSYYAFSKNPPDIKTPFRINKNLNRH